MRTHKKQTDFRCHQGLPVWTRYYDITQPWCSGIVTSFGWVLLHGQIGAKLMSACSYHLQILISHHTVFTLQHVRILIYIWVSKLRYVCYSNVLQCTKRNKIWFYKLFDRYPYPECLVSLIKSPFLSGPANVSLFSLLDISIILSQGIL